METVDEVVPARPDVVSRRRAASTAVTLFVVLFAVYGATATHGAGSIDVRAPAVEAWRLATSGSPWLEDVVHRLPGNAWLHAAPNGHVVADRMAGPVLLSLPFYLLRGGSPAPSSFSVVPAGLAAAFLTAGTVVLLFLALWPRLGRRTAVVASLAFALATPTWSVSADAPWTHTLTQFGIAGAAFGASRNRYWTAGLFLAVGITGRPHLALVAAVLGLGMSWATRSARPAVAVGVPTALTFGLLACWGRAMFGVWTFSTPGYGGHGSAALGGHPVVPGLVGVQAHVVNYLGFLLSPARGLFVWTPVLLILLPAVLRARHLLPRWSLWLSAGGVIYTLAQLQMEEFTGGSWFYGYRYGLELLTCVTPALAFAWPRVGRLGARIVPVLLALQFAVIALGSVVNALFVVGKDPWHFNTFARALMQAPVPLAALLACCVLVEVLVSRRLRADRSDENASADNGASRADC